MLSFLEEHMDLLTERLNSRGYNLQYDMQLRGEETEQVSTIHHLLHEEGHVPVVQYAFDVRT